jgi:hypothetical protein
MAGSARPGRPKVFGIGFHKTGTTSLAAALSQLGWNVCPGFGFMEGRIKERVHRRAAELVELYDAFEDNPWPLLYRDMDRMVPGARFVLTWRDPDRWYASVLRHFGKDETPMRRWIYGEGHGAPFGNRDVYVDRYTRHYEEVSRYFADRPGDLLWLRLEEGEGWKELGAFLGVPVPEGPFPRANANAGAASPLVRALKQTAAGRLAREAYQRYVRGYGLRMK